MYDVNKRNEMLQCGFWPIRETRNGKEIERMATAMGNLQYRPSLYDRFSLSNAEYHGEGIYCIVVFDAE